MSDNELRVHVHSQVCAQECREASHEPTRTIFAVLHAGCETCLVDAAVDGFNSSPDFDPGETRRVLWASDRATGDEKEKLVGLGGGRKGSGPQNPEKVRSPKCGGPQGGGPHSRQCTLFDSS